MWYVQRPCGEVVPTPHKVQNLALRHSGSARPVEWMIDRVYLCLTEVVGPVRSPFRLPVNPEDGST